MRPSVAGMNAAAAAALAGLRRHRRVPAAGLATLARRWQSTSPPATQPPPQPPPPAGDLPPPPGDQPPRKQLDPNRFSARVFEWIVDHPSLVFGSLAALLVAWIVHTMAGGRRRDAMIARVERESPLSPREVANIAAVAAVPLPVFAALARIVLDDAAAAADAAGTAASAAGADADAVLAARREAATVSPVAVLATLQRLQQAHDFFTAVAAAATATTAAVPASDGDAGATPVAAAWLRAAAATVERVATTTDLWLRAAAAFPLWLHAQGGTSEQRRPRVLPALSGGIPHAHVLERACQLALARQRGDLLEVDARRGIVWLPLPRQLPGAAPDGDGAGAMLTRGWHGLTELTGARRIGECRRVNGVAQIALPLAPESLAEVAIECAVHGSVPTMLMHRSGVQLAAPVTWAPMLPPPAAAAVDAALAAAPCGAFTSSPAYGLPPLHDPAMRQPRWYEGTIAEHALAPPHPVQPLPPYRVSRPDLAFVAPSLGMEQFATIPVRAAEPPSMAGHEAPLQQLRRRALAATVGAPAPTSAALLHAFDVADGRCESLAAIAEPRLDALVVLSIIGSAVAATAPRSSTSKGAAAAPVAASDVAAGAAAASRPWWDFLVPAQLEEMVYGRPQSFETPAPHAAGHAPDGATAQSAHLAAAPGGKGSDGSSTAPPETADTSVVARSASPPRAFAPLPGSASTGAAPVVAGGGEAALPTRSEAKALAPPVSAGDGAVVSSAATDNRSGGGDAAWLQRLIALVGTASIGGTSVDAMPSLLTASQAACTPPPAGFAQPRTERLRLYLSLVRAYRDEVLCLSSRGGAASAGGEPIAALQPSTPPLSLGDPDWDAAVATLMRHHAALYAAPTDGRLAPRGSSRGDAASPRGAPHRPLPANNEADSFTLEEVADTVALLSYTWQISPIYRTGQVSSYPLPRYEPRSAESHLVDAARELRLDKDKALLARFGAAAIAAPMTAAATEGAATEEPQRLTATTRSPHSWRYHRAGVRRAEATAMDESIALWLPRRLHAVEVRELLTSRSVCAWGECMAADRQPHVPPEAAGNWLK